MLPERDSDFAGKKALDGPSRETLCFGRRYPARLSFRMRCGTSGRQIAGEPKNLYQIGLQPNGDER